MIKKYEKLVNLYFESWIKNDIDKFLSTIDDIVNISECNGEVYENKNQAQEWFQTWHANGDTVKIWDITERYFDELNSSVIVEWLFSCVCSGIVYKFLGCSVLKFKSEKIINIKEYKMEIEKKHPYPTK